jgi:hypothetical protein
MFRKIKFTTMKRILSILAIVLLITAVHTGSLTFAQENEKGVTLNKLWESTDLLTTSESVCYDASGHAIYVSCINGNPTDKDGNGFIAKLSVTGEITTLKWLTGFNAPKGMGIYKTKLFVTDIDRVVEIDIEKSMTVKEYPVEGAKFLNDITIDPAGNVYISDLATGKIHRILKGTMETWIQDSKIISPNGLYFEENEILIGTKNGIFSVRVEDKRIWQLVKDTGGIDGLEADGKGNYIISDWKGKIQLVNPERDPVILLNTSETGVNAADIEYISERNILLVPTFMDNRVMAYELIYK